MSVQLAPDQPAARLTKWAKEPSLMDLQDDLRIARPAHDARVAKVKGWLEVRDAIGAHKPKANKNRSQVQPKLVRRQAEWKYSALTEPFLSAEKLFDLSPTTYEDMAAAEQNEQLLDWQFRTKINRVSFIDEYVRTCVDEGAVVVRPGWRRETKIEKVPTPVYDFFPVTDQAQYDMLLQAQELMQTNPQGFEELPEDLQESARYTSETGIPVVAVQNGTTMVEEERVVRNHPTLEILDHENVIIDPNCGNDLSKANFAIISFETSKAELIADGRYGNLEFVNWSSAIPMHQPEHATNPNTDLQFKDELRKRIVAYEYWGFHDIDGKDSLTPIVATWVGNTMIRMEKNPFPDQAIPLVVVPYLPLKKQLTGEPDAELLSDNQAILGAVTRGMIDLMGKSANGQTGSAKGMLDVVNRRRFERGEDYEYNPQMPPAVGFHQHQYPEIPNSALTMLQLQNQEAEAMSGTKAFSGGLSGNAYGDVAAGVHGMLDAAAKREMSILRRLAQGIEEIGRKIVAMNQSFLTDEEVVQVTNDEYVTISREDLAGEYNIKVDISTAQIEEAQAQDLGFMLQTLGNTLPWEITQMLLMQIAKLKRMPTLAKMLKDYQPQPDPVAEKLKELEIAEIDAKIAKLRADAMLAQARAQSELAGADLKNLDFVEQETGTKHARDMQRQQQQGEANMMNEITKAVLAPAEKRPSDQNITNAVALHNIASASA